MKAVVLSWEGEAGEGRKHNCVFNGQECIALASTHSIFFFWKIWNTSTDDLLGSERELAEQSPERGMALGSSVPEMTNVLSSARDEISRLHALHPSSSSPRTTSHVTDIILHDWRKEFMILNCGHLNMYRRCGEGKKERWGNSDGSLVLDKSHVTSPGSMIVFPARYQTV